MRPGKRWRWRSSRLLTCRPTRPIRDPGLVPVQPVERHFHDVDPATPGAGAAGGTGFGLLAWGSVTAGTPDVSGAPRVTPVPGARAGALASAVPKTVLAKAALPKTGAVPKAGAPAKAGAPINTAGPAGARHARLAGIY